VRGPGGAGRGGGGGEEAYLMLLPDLFFSFGGGHRFLCDDKGIGEHWEYFNIECEANLFRGVIGLGHYFQCCCIPCFISC